MDEKECLIKLVKSEINGTPFEEELKDVIPQLSTNLYTFAKTHDLAHLVGDVLDKNGLLEHDANVKRKFLQERNIAIYRYEQLHYELERICRILEEEKIEHVPLKGSVLRNYYKKPWMRTSCDIDILIKKENLEFAIKSLEKHGFKYDRKEDHDAHIWSESGIHLELHFNLMEENVAGKSAELLSKAWEWVKPCDGWNYRLKFDDAYFYFYHIAHKAKHFTNGGCGIRLFLDTWILTQSKAFIKDGSEELLRQAELLTFAQKCETLASVWFGEEKHDELTKEMETYIFGAGIYGTLDNRIALKQAKFGGKGKYLLSRIFLPYSLLKMSYPKLEKYPILFPFYQVARWFRVLFGKNNKSAFRELKGIATAKEDRKENLVTLCDNLGLQK